MTETKSNDTTPDALMADFRGRSLTSIILFTVAAHAVLLLGTSGPYLWKRFAGADTSGMSEDERVELAVKEANASLKKIAEEHGLKPQDLGSRFASGKPAKTSQSASPTAAPPAETGSPAESKAPPEPKSAIEEEIQKVEKGPAVPPVDDGEEDLFK